MLSSQVVIQGICWAEVVLCRVWDHTMNTINRKDTWTLVWRNPVALEVMVVKWNSWLSWDLTRRTAYHRWVCQAEAESCSARGTTGQLSHLGNLRACGQASLVVFYGTLAFPLVYGLSKLLSEFTVNWEDATGKLTCYKHPYPIIWVTLDGTLDKVIMSVETCPASANKHVTMQAT